MSYGRTWDEQRFSPLKQINDKNAGKLGLAWYADLNTFRGIEGTPLVVDGCSTTSRVFNVVTAYDARKRQGAVDPSIPRSSRSGRAWPVAAPPPGVSPPGRARSTSARSTAG